jgi:hypothetical protein
MKRFRELVRERRSLLARKERDWQEIYAAASLKHLLETVSAEMSAGIVHDADEVKGLIELAGEVVEKAKVKHVKPRFRGVGR